MLRALRVLMRQWGEAGSEALASSQVASTTSPRGIPGFPRGGGGPAPWPRGAAGHPGGGRCQGSTQGIRQEFARLLLVLVPVRVPWYVLELVLFHVNVFDFFNGSRSTPVYFQAFGPAQRRT